jgi:hypothetical protein
MRETLAKYLPENSIDFVMDFIVNNNTQLNIKYNRITKYGDYRPPQGKYAYHRISINYGLNQYHFFLTFLHEAAHLIIWNKYKNTVSSHGIEWQEEYRKLARNFLNENYFPKDLLPALKEYFSQRKIKASSSSIVSAMRKYDTGKQKLLLDDIPENSVFRIHNGMTFKKGKKLRTRYLCQELHSGRQYRVSGLAEVKLLQEHER